MEVFRNMDSNVTEKLVIDKIDEFIRENFKTEKNELPSMQLSRKMTLVNMKNLGKWEEFKLELRELGYII